MLKYESSLRNLITSKRSNRLFIRHAKIKKAESKLILPFRSDYTGIYFSISVAAQQCWSFTLMLEIRRDR